MQPKSQVQQATRDMSNTRTIVRNTGWSGLESVFSAVVTLFTSIAIARTLGPSRTGYIIYVSLISSFVSNLGGIGIPATTQKYMAEFIGMGDHGTARHIYFRTLFLQMGMATLATGGLLLWVLGDANAGFRIASALIVLSIWPAMVNSISAQANIAMEDLQKNLPASALSILAFFLAILATTIFNWGVVGVGASMLLMRTVDLLFRFFPTWRRIVGWDKNHVHPVGLRSRMLTFLWQSVASMIVTMIVWDRSEIFLLKHLCADIREVAYYSVAFSMGERLLLTSAVFGLASGATIFAQYGRDKSKLASITASSFRYLALTSIPIHAIAAALAVPALLLLYGNQYKGASMVVTIAPLLCMPKAFMGPIQSLLQSVERQSYVIVATVLAGIVDMAVAWALIPAHGAVGACIGSGAAQVTAIGIMWAVGIYQFDVKLPWVQVAKITFISAAAALTAHYVAVQLSPLWAILFGGSASLLVLFALLYLLRVLEPQDRARFSVVTAMMPKALAGPADKFLTILTRPGLATATTTSV